MLTYKGKYNQANVMIDSIDESTVSQIYTCLNHPAFAGTYIAIMPDCHAGAGVVVGYTAKMNGYVIPNVVGVDIGCGVLAVNLGASFAKKDYEHLDHFIKTHIPSGFGTRSLSEKLPNKKTPTDVFDRQLLSSVRSITGKIGQDAAKAIGSIGTLGGGNHFIELDHDDATGDDWLVIHSGSRNFGLRVANYHQDRAKELIRKMFLGADAYKGLEYLPIELGGQEYLDDMRIAQDYALLNRRIMAELIVGWVFGDYRSHDLETVESIHNYISFEDNIIRKGAVSAHLDERLIIPFNMRDGVAICRGKGSKKWNYSAPHGAGRLLSRRQAKDTLGLEEFKESMRGIYTTTANASTLDEAPGAYKDMDIIVAAISETAEIELMLKPVYNFKDSDEDGS